MAQPGTTNPRSKGGVIWWNMHVPRDQWSDQCPEHLTAVDDADRAVLATYDEDYHCLSWQEVFELIESNQLQKFKRWPSDLRRYRDYMAVIKREHGSVGSFMLNVRIGWNDVTPRGGPFEHPEDYKILLNDWPYGIDAKIKHVVVWTKFGFEEDGVDLTLRARRQIDEFVKKTFTSGTQVSRVAWFKNWAALKSVHAVEHFHVMLYDPDLDLIKRVTGGDEMQKDAS